MAKVNAKCTNCGKVLFIDNEKDAVVCPHCNCAFVTEKAIELYRQAPEKVASKGKRFFKMFGSVLLLILSCIWHLICTILLVDFISDLTKGGKK